MVADRGREVHVPSPSPRSNWPQKPEPWQRFYLGLGAGRCALSEEEMNQELWIAFLLDRGAGRYSPWWMDLELAFDASSSAGSSHDDAAKRRCLHPADAFAGTGPAAGSHTDPLGQAARSGATDEEDRARDGE